MAEQFAPDLVERLREIKEVRIVTGEPSRTHRTVIWVVVGEGDRVLIRTYRGRTSRWYREVRATPECELEVDGRDIPVRAVVATDAASIEACSQGYRTKYGRSASMPWMVADEVLDTTLELVPR